MILLSVEPRLDRNGGQEAHIRDRIREVGIVMKGVWGIGKRKRGKDWSRKMWLFDTLVWTVMGYGVEIWGWQERKEAEGMQERYIIGGGLENARVYGKRGSEEGQTEDKGEEESMEI